MLRLQEKIKYTAQPGMIPDVRYSKAKSLMLFSMTKTFL